MLSDVKKFPKPEREEYRERIRPLEERLDRLSRQIKAEKLPVAIVFEGFGAAGKGSAISSLIQSWDPRGYRVRATQAPDENDRRYPFLRRFWSDLPSRGQIAVFDRSWYTAVSVDRVDQELPDAHVQSMLAEIRTFERQLTDDGYLVVKLFLFIERGEQKKRFDELLSSPDTAWRVTERDLRHNRDYKKHLRAFDEMLESTDTPNAPWHVVDSSNFRGRNLQIFSIVADAMGRALGARAAARPAPSPESGAAFAPSSGNGAAFAPSPGNGAAFAPSDPLPSLAGTDLSKTMDPYVYKEALRACQSELAVLHNRIYRERIPVIIAYEGWDAAGKGGNIKRLAAALDARGYEVVPVSSPTPDELARHYLWRFWIRLPRTGHIAVFDRSWYGRVLVERVEGLCPPERVENAYREINEFERTLCGWGAVVLKFYLHISSDVQLARFREREGDPDKTWKITEEDWRNRGKWPQYEQAVEDMLRRTSTELVPWHVIESNDKKYARIRVLRLVIEALTHALGD